MRSVRSFVLLWAACSVLIVAYAACDLSLNPTLKSESTFTMQPDVARLPELAHWGGRLLHHRALGLLFANAVVLGGFFALFLGTALKVIARRRDPRATEQRVSVVPVITTPSTPPGAN